MTTDQESPDQPTIRRGFVDIPDGQVHYRTAGSERETLAPLVCLHQSPFSSLTFQEALPLLGASRRVVAFDTPGFGESFRPPRKPAIPDYARWLHEAAQALGFERFDVLGLFTGAAIASDMAVQFAGSLRRLVLIGPPLFTPEQQRTYLAQAWPTRPQPDGSHLMPEWERVMQRALPDTPFARRCDAFQEFWRGGGDAIWGEEAVSVYPLKDTLPQIRQRVLVLQPDGLLGDAEGACALIARTERVRLPGVRAWSMMQTAPAAVSAAVAAFLDVE